MKRFLVLMLLLPLLWSCNKKSATDDGHIVGNGGDYLENLFIQGKLHAIRVLQRLRATTIAELERESQIASRADLVTLHDRSGDLIDNIRNAKHSWSQKLPAGCPYSTCGCTLPNRPNEVFLSYDNCRATSNPSQAGSVLLHESTHAKLKSDEEEARQLTSVAYELWAGWGHPETPHWLHVAFPKELGILTIPPVKVGEEIVYLGKEIWRYHPGAESWTSVELRKEIPQLDTTGEDWFFAHNIPHSIDGKMTVYAHCLNERIAAGSGISVDPLDGNVRVLPRKDAPTSRIRTVQASSDRMLFVWGGESCEEDDYTNKTIPSDFHDGAFFTYESGWTRVTDAGGPKYLRGARAAWTGREFVVWTGKGSAYRYDPTKKKWLEPLSVDLSDTDDWTMGPIAGGVVILTQNQAAIYRHDGKFEVQTIGRAPREIKLSESEPHFGLNAVTIYSLGLMSFEIDTLRWRYVTRSPYPQDSWMKLLFSTGSEFVVMPLQFMKSSNQYGAIYFL